MSLPFLILVCCLVFPFVLGNDHLEIKRRIEYVNSGIENLQADFNAIKIQLDSQGEFQKLLLITLKEIQDDQLKSFQLISDVKSDILDYFNGKIFILDNISNTVETSIKSSYVNETIQTPAVSDEIYFNQLINNQLENTCGMNIIRAPVVDLTKIETPGYIGGRLQNLNEGSPANQYRGCGGIVVGTSGRIIFYQDWHTNEPYKCVWTVRNFKKYFHEFTLQSDELGDGNIITLTNLDLAHSENTTLDVSATKIIKSGDRQTHKFHLWGGVLVMLIVNKVPKHMVQFQITYCEFGIIGVPHNSAYHYHFRETSGRVNWPADRGVSTYNPKSQITFVINPLLLTNNSLNIKLEFLDIDETVDCEWNPATLFFLRSTRDKTYMERIGPMETGNRFCGHLGNISTTLSGDNKTDVWVAVFWTHESEKYSGFRFSWSLE